MFSFHLCETLSLASKLLQGKYTLLDSFTPKFVNICQWHDISGFIFTLIQVQIWMEKIHQYVLQKADREDLQKEFAMLCVWRVKWKMEFNSYECVMHGKKLPSCILAMMNSEQAIANQITDLRIVMALRKYQFNAQWQVERAIWILGRLVETKAENVFVDCASQ